MIISVIILIRLIIIIFSVHRLDRSGPDHYGLTDSWIQWHTFGVLLEHDSADVSRIQSNSHQISLFCHRRESIWQVDGVNIYTNIWIIMFPHVGLKRQLMMIRDEMLCSFQHLIQDIIQRRLSESTKYPVVYIHSTRIIQVISSVKMYDTLIWLVFFLFIWV